jgi:hypothetical protein
VIRHSGVQETTHSHGYLESLKVPLRSNFESSLIFRIIRVIGNKASFNLVVRTLLRVITAISTYFSIFRVIVTWLAIVRVIET